MKHPEREEWIPFLFNEAKPSDQNRLAGHLEHCDQCRSELQAWQRSLRQLDDWNLPPAPAPRPATTLSPWLQLAAAALVLLAFGFGLGRFSARPLTLAQVRAAIEPDLRRQITGDLAQTVRTETDRAASASLATCQQQLDHLFAAYTEAVDNNRAQDARVFSTALQKLRAQYANDFLALKKDVDTIAVNADAGLRQTEQQLVHLAGYTQSANQP